MQQNNNYVGEPLMKLFFVVLGMCILATSVPAGAQTIESAAICGAVVNHDASDTRTQFGKGERAYCWIKIKDAPAGSKILVAWYRGNQLQHTTTLPLNYPNMRTYAYKTLHEEGQWRADIKKPDGTVLMSLPLAAGNVKAAVSDKGTSIVKNSGEETEKKAVSAKEENLPANGNVIKEASVVVLPPDYDKNKTYPAVVMLPFTGGTATNFLGFYGGWGADEKEQLEELLTSFYPEKKTRASKSFILILPAGAGSEADHTWQGFEAAIERYERKVLEDLAEFGPKYNIDPKAVVLAGFSLGGDMSWAISMRNPDLFRGAVVMGSRCSYPGKGSMSVMAKSGFRFFLVMGELESDIRLKIFHQSKDLLDANKVSYIYKSVPDEGHTIAPREMFKDALDYVLFRE